MGYRSSGHIIFPEHFLPYYEEMCPDTPLDEYDDVDFTTDGYIALTFTSWKWYDSYDSIQQLQRFMSQLDQWAFDQESMEVRYQTDSPIDDIPRWCIYSKERSGDGTINMYKPITYVQEEWTWGFNIQGEEAADYNSAGYPGECGLYQRRSVENPFAYEEGGWAYQLTFRKDVSENDAEKWRSDFKERILDDNVEAYETEIIKWWNDKLVFRMSGPNRSDGFTPVKQDDLTHGWNNYDGYIEGSKDINYDLFEDNQTEEYVGAIWDSEMITNTHGDYYDMEIYDYSVAEWDGSVPTSLEPDFRGAYK